MNILLIAFDYPPLTGGIANLSYEVAKNLSAENDLLLVVAPAIKGYKEWDNKSKLITFRVPDIKIIREVVLFFMMLYLVFKFKIDIIDNLTWYPSAVISYFVTISTGVPYVIHVHAMDYLEDKRGVFNKLKYNWLRTFIKRLTFEGAKRVIAVSNFMKDVLIVRGVDALKIKVIAPGVDCERFVPDLDAKKIISRHGLENKRILLTVSRLDDYKGHDMVIKALPKLISKFPDIRYLIVGTGPYERRLSSLAKELNLNEYVIFTGWVDDEALPLYYNACDIFILLSREVYEEAKVEGYGLVFLEANACAKPIVAGRSGGIKDAVIDKVTGVLVDPLNLDEIDSAITKILSDIHYAKSLGANGLDRIKKERLDWHSAGKRIGQVFVEVKSSR